MSLWACSNETVPAPVSNQAPFIRITAGPVDDQEDSYSTRIWWTGWDNDGIVEHYEYVVDPDPAFSLDEVRAPEEFPEISRQVIRGPRNRSDTLRFSKPTGDGIASFDYIQTTDFNKVFSFSTTMADTGQIEGSQFGPLPRYSGFHTLYLRCQDNEQTYSDIDRLAFTAVSITPSAQIVRPNITAEFLTVGPQITFTWDGFDPDATTPRKKPVAYLHKLIKLDELTPPIRTIDFRDPEFIFYRLADHLPWTRQSAESLSTSFFLEPPSSYAFAVRAIDESGAIEPFLDRTRGSDAGNVLVFSSISSGGSPVLTINEASLGTFSARGGGTFEFEIAVNQPLYFNWTAQARDYGGTITGFNYGSDITNLDAVGPNSGWVGWSELPGNVEPISFDTPGVHSVYIKARDEGGGETLAVIIFKVIEFTFANEFMFVDDYRDQIKPRDNERDAFWDEMFRESGKFGPNALNENTVFEAHGPNDGLFFVPQVPTLEQMGNNELLIWETFGGGSDGTTAFLRSSQTSRKIQAYLRGGGKLWLSGHQTVATTIATADGRSDFAYPHDLLPGFFAYDFLKIFSSQVGNVGVADMDRHGLWEVTPFPGEPEFLPTMQVDPAKMQFGDGFGVPRTDLVIDPIFEATEDDFTGQIDSLYAYKSLGNFRTPPRASTFDRKLCATRWHDPSPDRKQGRIAWFGFSLYYFNNDQAQQTFNSLIDWFREESVLN